MTDADLRLRLATLLLEALEIGSGKQEWDVVDEVFSTFNLNWNEIEGTFPHSLPGRADLLRVHAARELAKAVPTAQDLLNTVVRCGGRFVSMLEETYARLARHAATTSGASETFRLERSGVDETQLTISPAFLEQVHLMMERIRRVPLGVIDEAALASFTLWDNGESYGRWPVLPDADTDRLLNAALNLSWIGPIIQQREATDSSWGEAASHWSEANLAAARLVSAAEAIVSSHGAHLDALSDVDPASVAREVFTGNAFTQREGVRAAEIDRFRATRFFGTTALSGFVHGIEDQSAVGLTDNLKPVVIQKTNDFWPQTGVGGLAAFVAMWRLGLWAEREQENPANTRRFSDPMIMTGWLSWVASACTEATAWLEDEILQVTTTATVNERVDVLKEFLNLPLWRQRNLLYEVWVLCVTLDACEVAGWTVELTGLTEVEGAWVISVGPTATPTARLRLSADEEISLDVWREPSRETSDATLTPDLAVSTVGPYCRDLLVVEAKDRVKMGVGKEFGAGPTLDRLQAGQRTALAVAQRYAVGLRANATWVCNHCDFRQGADPAVNHGDAWTEIHLADNFRPGEVPEAFNHSVKAALELPPKRDIAKEQPKVASGLLMVVDVTASMQPRLSEVFEKLLAPEVGQFGTYRAVLFSDHGDGEPFLVRKLGPFPDAATMVESVRVQPDGGGGDIEEALEDAMQRCRELVYDIGPQTILILTDAPPHKTQNCPYEIDFTTEVRALLDLGCDILVANDWLKSGDLTWIDFAGMANFRLAPLQVLISAGQAH
ncbi:hypothetical protein [Arthrobacter sp. SAFR-044]|uniref:hypothetical protein n=1 Tax=Arthrobacter sp. SAFR-044 TaxID=3387278 RepID=UPI003F7C096C